jgi:hypothetical protein
MSSGSIQVRVDTEAVARVVAELDRSIVSVQHTLVDVGSGLHRDLNELKIETLGQLVLLARQMANVENAVHKMIESSAQTEMIRAYSEFVGQNTAIQSAARQVNDQFHKATDRVFDISRRFDRIDTELLESYHRDIRRTGSHIFEIFEHQYQKGVETRMQTEHKSFHETVLRSIDSIRRFRESTLSQILDTAIQKLFEFIDKRRAFHENIQDKITSEPLDVEGEVQIPFHFVELKDSQKPSVFVGSEIRSGDGKKDVAVALQDSEMFSELRRQLVQHATELNKNIRWRRMNESEIATMKQQFAVLEERGYISAEYHELLSKVLSTHPPQVPEKQTTKSR